MAYSSSLDLSGKKTVAFATQGDSTTSLIGKGVKFFSTDAGNVDYKPSGRFTTGSVATTLASGSVANTKYVAIAAAAAVGGLVLILLLVRKK